MSKNIPPTDNRIKYKPPVSIEPYALYTVDEAAAFLRTNEKFVRQEIDNRAIVVRSIGKGYKILGENLLAYAGSSQYQAQPLQPDMSGANIITLNDESK